MGYLEEQRGTYRARYRDRPRTRDLVHFPAHDGRPAVSDADGDRQDPRTWIDPHLEAHHSVGLQGACRSRCGRTGYGK